MHFLRIALLCVEIGGERPFAERFLVDYVRAQWWSALVIFSHRNLELAVIVLILNTATDTSGCDDGAADLLFSTAVGIDTMAL